MKTILVCILVLLANSYRYNQKSQSNLSHGYRQKSRAKMSLKIRLKAMQKEKKKFLYHMKSLTKHRAKNKVILKGMNLNQVDIRNRVNTANGDLLFTQDNVRNLYQQCQQANKKNDQRAENANNDEANVAFVNFVERVKKGLNLVGDQYLRNYWIYFVGSEGNCDMKVQDASAMFMLLPQGDPRDLKFTNVNNRIGFVKVCLNGEKTLVQKGQGLRFNINTDKLGYTDYSKRITIKEYVEQQFAPITRQTGLNEQQQADEDKKIQERDARIRGEEDRYMQLSEGPYMLRNCAFDSCSETPLYYDEEMIEVDNNKKVKGNCQNLVSEDESIIIKNDNTDPSKISIVDKNQVDSLGKLEQV